MIVAWPLETHYVVISAFSGKIQEFSIRPRDTLEKCPGTGGSLPEHTVGWTDYFNFAVSIRI
jgi:hypothetical protein